MTFKYRFIIKALHYEFSGNAHTLNYIKTLFYKRLDRCGESICYVSKRCGKDTYTKPKMFWFKLT